MTKRRKDVYGSGNQSVIAEQVVESEMGSTPVNGTKGESGTRPRDFAMCVPSVFQVFTEVSLLQLKWAECSFTGLLQCVNVLGQKSHLGPGPRRSNGGFTRLINKP